MLLYTVPLFSFLFFISVHKVYLQEEEYDYNYEYEPLNCSTTETIRGGSVTYSQEGLEGSVLTYHCGPGRYPFPVRHRQCGADGEWSPMRSATGRPSTQASCKEILCPAQLQLDHGNFWPRDQWFRPGTVQSFSCKEGFPLYGSAQRNCTLSGDWTGNVPICDNHADDCTDPGIPPGALRSGRNFRTGEKVDYQCQSGLTLLGSAERFCLDVSKWSGSEPRCQAPYIFDSPTNVAAAMAGSLSGLMDVMSPQYKKQVSFGRTVRITQGSRMNIFILLDTSGSISLEDFEKSREATIALIGKLDSYEVQIQFHVTSFASQAKDIVNITDTFMSSKAEKVISQLKKFDHKSHGSKTGTNLYAALYRVAEMIALLKQNRKESHFEETQNIIIVETDGYSNTGTNPLNALFKIRALLGYNPRAKEHTNETLLDIYVFGVGEKVNTVELNGISSNKSGEKHLFILRDYNTLGEVFNSMISDESLVRCGVAQEYVSSDHEPTKPVYTRPWHVTLTMSEGSTVRTCLGSIVSQNWVLTAAHCFARASNEKVRQPVEVQHGEGTVFAKRVIMHPEYDTSRLKHRNVSEFYDYDIALVEVDKSIPLSWKARPICLPCTEPASRAMRIFNSTCEEHRKELLPHRQTPAFFIHKTDSKRKETRVQTESNRVQCVEKAKQTLTKPTDVTVDEYIPDRFLCTGGSEGYQDSITCKGDSGGSLFLQHRMRYFQVGVVSWGTKEVCETSDPAMIGYQSDRPPPDARDFHISLFTVVPWLRQHLGQEIKFLPVDN
ncbi:complement C2 [Lampris incognitus]|uniref:complement C2 n=1 Tax=Lampris incognitus TaxID=2546036 RepID=UPI0024B4EF14|nr:complement C2 [Lampris incognitus]